MNKLTDDEVAERLAGLKEWAMHDGRIEKTFEFDDFQTAMVFMNRLAPVAEELNHHPDWSNTYNKVRILLTSHEVGGLTEKDFSFALAAERAAQLQ